MASYRLLRVASRIKFLVGSIIQRELSDPRIGLVTVLKVEVTPDLKEASVYVSIFGGSGDRSKTIHALEDARGFVQREVGRNIHTKSTPRLKFIVDESQDRVSRLEALMAGTIKDEEDVMANKPAKKDGKSGKEPESTAQKSSKKPSKPEKKGPEKARKDPAPNENTAEGLEIRSSRAAKPAPGAKKSKKTPGASDEGGAVRPKRFPKEDLEDEEKGFQDEFAVKAAPEEGEDGFEDEEDEIEDEEDEIEDEEDEFEDEEEEEEEEERELGY